jgi:hypothetical protein
VFAVSPKVKPEAATAVIELLMLGWTSSGSLMVHMEVEGGYVKQIWLVLGWARG